MSTEVRSLPATVTIPLTQNVPAPLTVHTAVAPKAVHIVNTSNVTVFVIAGTHVFNSSEADYSLEPRTSRTLNLNAPEWVWSFLATDGEASLEVRISPDYLPVEPYVPPVGSTSVIGATLVTQRFDVTVPMVVGETLGPFTVSQFSHIVLAWAPDTEARLSLQWGPTPKYADVDHTKSVHSDGINSLVHTFTNRGSFLFVTVQTILGGGPSTQRLTVLPTNRQVEGGIIGGDNSWISGTNGIITILAGGSYTANVRPWLGPVKFTLQTAATAWTAYFQERRANVAASANDPVVAIWNNNTNPGGLISGAEFVTSFRIIRFVFINFDAVNRSLNAHLYPVTKT